jgi:hypothetical protein
MKQYNTNIARTYGMTAGFKTKWSGVREIIQNALDGHDLGHDMCIEFGKARDRSGKPAIKVSNAGIGLSQDALVIGFTTKSHDHNARGQHGEGLVVGLNALLNAGCEVWIRTGDEVWIPKHVMSETGLETLVIEIRKQAKVSQDFIVEIKGIAQKEWESYKENILSFDSELEAIEFHNGRVLTNPKYKNKLFVKGIFVCRLPDDYNWGYDLKVEINRDREVSDPWRLRDTIKALIKDGVDQRKFTIDKIWEILQNDECGEAQCFKYINYDGKTAFNEAFVERFHELNGEDAIPVNSIGDSQRVEHFGKKGAVVSNTIKKIIEVSSGDLESRLDEGNKKSKFSYSYGDLNEEEKKNFFKIVRLIEGVEHWFSDQHVEIVDFHGENIYGTYKDGTNPKIKVAKKILDDKQQLITTLVHEVAHRYGGDAEMSHERAKERICSEIITNLMDGT